MAHSPKPVWVRNAELLRNRDGITAITRSTPTGGERWEGEGNARFRRADERYDGFSSVIERANRLIDHNDRPDT